MLSRAVAGCGAVVALLCLFASPARADANGARWWVVTDGEPCLHAREELEREVVLACGAVGGTCRVVRSHAEAEFVATLRCAQADDRWKLELTAANGHVVGGIDLSGPTEDRLREAAVEIARDEAPERTLAATALENSLVTTQQRDAAPRKATARGTLDFALSGAVGLGTARRNGNGTSVAGGRAAIGIKLGAETTFVLSAAYLSNFSVNHDAIRVFRSGLGIAFGAPFVPTDIIGGAFEFGVEAQQMYGPPQSSRVVVSTKSAYGPFGRASFFGQIPWRTVRPYAGLSWGLAESTGLDSSAEVGLIVPLLQ